MHRLYPVFPKGMRVSVEGRPGVVHGTRFNVLRGRREVAVVADEHKGMIEFVPVSQVRVRSW